MFEKMELAIDYYLSKIGAKKYDYPGDEKLKIGIVFLGDKTTVVVSPVTVLIGFGLPMPKEGATSILSEKRKAVGLKSPNGHSLKKITYR